MKRLLLFFLAWPLMAAMDNYTVAFVGMTPGGAPAFEQSFDRHLQEKLSTTQDINTVDFTQIQKLRGKINYNNLATVSPQILESLRRFCSDSTVFVWGAVDHYSVRNARSGLLHAKVEATAAVRIMMYSFSERNFTFSKTIACSASVPTGWIFFNPTSAAAKVSAVDYAAAIETLEKDAVDKSVVMVSSISKNDLVAVGRARRANKGNNPTSSDVFNVPSVEAAAVDGSKGPDTAANETGIPATREATVAGKTDNAKSTKPGPLKDTPVKSKK
ncbi:MAG: hypothetical protein PHC61_08980 [Chitinivibrionales bacterium]|nr:hypothetical protein [Chitinivibrionales bacterium]